MLQRMSTFNLFRHLREVHNEVYERNCTVRQYKSEYVKTLLKVFYVFF